MDSLLKKRHETHGDYQEQFRVAQELKEVLRTYEWNKLSDVQREALEMICTKISRIVVGDCSHVDHWNDVAGYALRVVDSLKRFSDASHDDHFNDVAAYAVRVDDSLKR